MARPSSYDADVAEAICLRLAQDESLVSICADDRMPGLTTVYRWRDDNEEFRANYARARTDQGHTVADTIGDIRKMILSGEIDANVGTAAANLAKWEAGRRASKDFGDKTTTELTGKDGAAIEIEQRVREDADAVARAIAGLTVRAGAASVDGSADPDATGGAPV